jgi:hypothetical protein
MTSEVYHVLSWVSNKFCAVSGIELVTLESGNLSIYHHLTQVVVGAEDDKETNSMFDWEWFIAFGLCNACTSTAHGWCGDRDIAY